MKKNLSLLLAGSCLALLLAGCNTPQSSASTAPPAPSETSTPALSQPQPESQTSDTGTGTGAAADTERLQSIYDAVAEAAGLSNAVNQTMLDVNAFGGVTEENVLHMVGGLSRVQNDSGLVLVFQTASGTAGTLAAELEGFRDSFLNGPAYEEFADAEEATRQARIVTGGDIVVYAVPSVEAGAGFEAVDAAIASALG